ncbi:nucleoside/nucleotide kinase family protein [Pleomorphomonas oryzae]|uniref:nucleoside/nucleotide kinase family protein n=1 Tax=Pleomorphomonas oryzae TaxID=261934 RepID=UPI0003F73FD0|nr:nucleoside/nucleotide kinase family protein [Pleomorphomonas oryzae]
MTFTSPAELAQILLDRSGNRRIIVALAGAPGSGKSTLAETLAATLNERINGVAAVLPMDGFHFDDIVLNERGLRARKGAPETFDVSGLAHLLERIRQNVEPEIAVPIFDRALEISRAGARLIPRTVRIVIVEGNYLLLDRAPWSSLTFDLSVMLVADPTVLRQRLLKRWADLDIDEQEAVRKIDGNDVANAKLIQECSRKSDYFVHSE